MFHLAAKLKLLARNHKTVCLIPPKSTTIFLGNLDPQAWLADVLARLPDHPAKLIHELLPWNWRPQSIAHAA
jgi:hypothetical protein